MNKPTSQLKMIRLKSIDMSKRVIPHLSSKRPLSLENSRFLDALKSGGFRGEIERDLARRLIAGTDNSVYQLLPEAIIYPRSSEDIRIAMTLLGRAEHKKVNITPRGGGTGTNGQSLTEGISMDLSRYLNQINEMNLVEEYAWVEAGVILDQLNDSMRPHNVFFAPNLSPSSRATIGGMISTDAAGKGSRVYGKTSDHILELEVTLIGGEEVVFTQELGAHVSARAKVAPHSFEARVALPLMNLMRQKQRDIERIFPQLSRFMTGYNLKMLYDPMTDQLNLIRLIAGAEGTLGVVTRAKVKLTPLPKARRLILFGYSRFQDALGSAQLLLNQEPSAIETIDETLLSLAQADASYHQVKPILEAGSFDLQRVAAINLVEFEGEDSAHVDHRVTECLEAITPRYGEEDAPIGHVVATSVSDQNALWGVRKRGVGLLAARPGERRPIAFVEDTVVPPEQLSNYIRDFTNILDEEGVAYGLFGHVDVGCLHVRPALNLRDPEDEERFERISNRVATLVKSYGGLIWGEHGKGMRSAYSPDFFGELYPTLQQVKAHFDPNNQLNPGKVATPAGFVAELMPISSPLRGQRDRLIGPDALEVFEATVHCNGNGQCFDYQPKHIMCPSARVTRDRLHSPKGRAGVMRAWLAALSEQGYPLETRDLNPHLFVVSTGLKRLLELGGAPLSGARRLWAKRRQREDLSTQVYEAMHGCLSCKACASACPVRVDIPQIKSRFLHLYYQRYPRPLRDYFVSELERAAHWGSHVSSLWNWGVKSKIGRWASRRVIGLVDPPALSKSSALALLKKRGVKPVTAQRLSLLSDQEKTRAVILLPDAFNTFFEAEVIVDTFEALKKLGFEVFLAPFLPNGKGAHVKGRLLQFKRQVGEHLERLTPLATLGIPVVCVDPAVALTYRDEYPEIVGKPLPFQVSMLQEWLVTRLDQLPQDVVASNQRLRLFAHCTERSLSPAAERDWQTVFHHLGLQLARAEVGCCGMCGVFGHEREHEAQSKSLFAMSWESSLENSCSTGEQALVTGYSCRAQIKRCNPETTTAQHPLVFLNSILAQPNVSEDGIPR